MTSPASPNQAPIFATVYSLSKIFDAGLHQAKQALPEVAKLANLDPQALSGENGALHLAVRSFFDPDLMKKAAATLHIGHENLASVFNAPEPFSPEKIILKRGRSPEETSYRLLNEAGYVNGFQKRDQRRVRDLKTVREGMECTTLIAWSVPLGEDMMGFLHCLKFGPRRPTGMKDMNATLRSLGMYDERYEGDKLESLWHPFASRGAGLLGGAKFIGTALYPMERAHREYDLLLPRLAVESLVVDFYLERGDWYQRMIATTAPEHARSNTPERLAEVNAAIKEAVREAAPKLNIPLPPSLLVGGMILGSVT
jgi:hypothetical protein